MAKSVRVYELARQLGMANADVIELCGSLGVDVKSHSSGMVEAQADRVRPVSYTHLTLPTICSV